MKTFLQNIFKRKREEISEKVFENNILRAQDIIAPAFIEIKQNYLKLGEKIAKSFFIFSYPRYLNTAWLSPIINLDTPMDISMFFHPIETGLMLKKLRRKVTEVQAEIMEKEEKGLIRDPALEIGYQDLEELRDRLQTAQERMFNFGLYLTIYGNNEKEIRQTETILRSILESRLIYIKPTLYQQKQGFISCSPYGLDQIGVHTPMNTAPLSSVFPFVSFDFSSTDGILYGINSHNNSLVLFDRFSLENANEVVFAKAGSGKTIRWCEKVLVKDKNGIRLAKIGPLTENLIKKHGVVKIDEEIEGVPFPPNLKVYSFNKNLKGEWSRMTVAMRKKAPKIYYKVKTYSGREITTTEDHNMVILKNGKVEIAKTSEIKEGEFIPLPKKVNSHKNNQKSLKFSNKKQMATLLITDEFLQLAGLITAKSTIYSYRKQCYALDISNTGPEILKIITSSLCQLGVQFYKTIDKKEGEVKAIKIYQRDFIEMIKEISGGRNSKQKKVWSFIFGLNKKQIAQYLSAYFEGDGKVESNKAVIVTSKSKDLISEISYLLYYFGIIAKISRIKKKVKNSIGEQKRTYWRISITGQNNLRKFSKSINFISKRKRKQLKFLIQKQENTNVDIIPGLALVIQEMYQLFPPLFWGIPEISEWKNGKRNISSQRLKRIIAEIRNRIQKFKEYKILDKLPELSKIFQLGKANEDLNRRLWQGLDQSWQMVKNKGVQPFFCNAFKVIETVNEENYDLKEIKEALHSGFREIDLPINSYSRSSQSALVARPKSNASYEVIQKSTQFVWQNYQKILNNKIPQIEKVLNRLKVLVDSDLFWDPIVEIKKIKNKKEKYVYDLTVDNEVFLAGQGGMFVHNSYAVKLEVLRYLMLGVDAIILDPENEYKALSEATGGSYFNFSLTSPHHLNPFDLPPPGEDERREDVLRSNTINLVGLLRIMLGGLTPEEDSVMDRAISETYAAKDITPEKDFSKTEPPLMSDLETVLKTMVGTESLVNRLQKFTKGTYSSFFNQPSNVDMRNKLVIFGIRNMEEELRTIALFIILRYIWKT